jgi:hypothetical protein
LSALLTACSASSASTTGKPTTTASLCAVATGTNAIGSARGITAAAVCAAEPATETSGAKRLQFRAQIIDLLFLFRMRLQHVVDLLAVGVRDLHATKAALTAALLHRVR